MCDGANAKWFITEDRGQTAKLKCKVCGDYKIVSKPIDNITPTGDKENKQ